MAQQPAAPQNIDGNGLHDPLKPSTSDDVVSAVVVNAAVTKAEDGTGNGSGTVAPPPTPIDPPINPVPPITPPNPEPIPAKLAWGRWTDAAVVNDISMPWRTALEGRTATVANNEYVLYRDNSTVSVLSPALGTLGFSLQQAQASVMTAGGERQAAAVSSGTLALNFTERNFATTLNVNSVPTGAVNLQAKGTLGADGIFYSRTPGQSIAGAVTLDAKSAGYLFEKMTSGGTLSGITLWGR